MIASVSGHLQKRKSLACRPIVFQVTSAPTSLALLMIGHTLEHFHKSNRNYSSHNKKRYRVRVTNTSTLVDSEDKKCVQL